MDNRASVCIVCIIFVVLLSSFVICVGNEQNVSQSGYVDNDFLHLEYIPFSFKYEDISSLSLLSDVPPINRILDKNDNFQHIEKEWRCKDGLVVILSAKYYLDYSAVEWITYISYNGKSNSKVISNLYGIDNSFLINEDDDLIIHTNKGDDCTKYSYQPYNIYLRKGQSEVFYPTQGDLPSGKSTTGPRGWPYWNIQNGNQGWILAVGWPGAWQNEIIYESSASFRVSAGQKNFRAVIRSGETIRTPLICVLSWKASDVETAQNKWRHFYLDHIIPRFNGEPEKTAIEIQSSLNESSIGYVQKYIDAGIKPRICWKDAGWYPTNTGSWLETGEWRLDPKKFPNGIRPFSNWAHQEGMECLLWYEPERVLGKNSLSSHHQDWLLSVVNWKSQILNLGNPECLDWLINHIDSMINDNGLDWYREDMNGSGPYDAWIQADMKLGKDRQGITENFYVQGHLALWDSLKRRHPGLHIDACASGGRRNDLETMHRAVPLLRSDYQWSSVGGDYIIGNQSHTWALSSWLPYQGSAVYEYEPHKFRSFYLPCFGMGRMDEKNTAAIKQAHTECKEIQPMMLYGDYWPLTPYSLESDEWIAWQFNREDKGDGCVQAFKREKCGNNTIRVKLRGLDANSLYLLKNFDRKEKSMISGKKLMKEGIKIYIGKKTGSVIYIYEKVKS